MLDFNVKFKGKGLEKLQRLHKQVDKAVQKTLKEFGEAAQQDARRRIAVSKTDPEGNPWAPWKFSTEKQRNRKGKFQPRNLLYNSGRLYRSIAYRVRNNSVQIGSTVEYAKYLQEGRKGSFGRGRMVPRVILDLNNDQTKVDLKKRLKDNLKKMLRK